MADASKIEWCDSTFNPWIGCTKVGPGCDHCYAEADFDLRKHRVKWGAGQERSRTAPANWKKPLAWNEAHDAFFAAHGRRQRVFCASLADVFDNEVPARWRADLFDLIANTPHLDWLLLTKRIGNAKRLMDEIAWNPGGHGPCTEWQPMPNVWLGATIVNQEEADRDIPKLLATPAAVRFLSMEPLLGPVDLHKYIILQCDRGSVPSHDDAGGVTCPHCAGRALIGCDLLNWVIVGGESGPHARPMHPDWPARLRDQCAAAGVPFLFKQWGEWKPLGQMPYSEKVASQERCSHKDDHYVKLDGRSHTIARDDHYQFDSSDVLVRDVGKKAAGRLLDRREHNQFPRAHHDRATIHSNRH